MTWFKKIPPIAYFVLLLVLLSVKYEYHETSLLRPMGMHRWRQVDCASISLNYYQNGMHFFKPELHNLNADNFTSGYGVSEAPILYYTVACLYTLFGPHEWIYRILNLFIFYLGIYALFRLVLLATNDVVWSLMAVLFIMVSPVAAYYANNFLTDSTAFALVLIAWWQFFVWIFTKSNSAFYWYVIMFSLAGLLKITTGINLVASIALLLIYFFLHGTYKKKFLKSLFALMVYLAIVFGWYLFALNYNETHQNNYFANYASPIWKFSKEMNMKVWGMITTYWKTQYFPKSVYWLFIPMLLIQFLVLSKISKWGTTFILLFMGSIAYSLLFFYKFHDHDYYILILFPALVFLFISSVSYLQTFSFSQFVIRSIQAFFLVVLLVNLNYTHKQLDKRYYGDLKANPVFHEYFNIKEYTRQLGINETDTVISLIDGTHCFSLYFMNLKGHTYLHCCKDSASIKKRIVEGASYLFVYQPEAEKNAYIRPFMHTPIGKYYDVCIYSLKDTAIQFTPFSPKIEKEVFVSGGNEVTNVENRFAFTTELTRVKPYQRYRISAELNKHNSDCYLVASDITGKHFYARSNRIKMQNELWNTITLEVLIDKSLKKDKLKIYAWNDGSDEVIFRNLLIEKLDY